MIFRKCENLKVNYLGKEFDSFDNNSTKDRKQLTPEKPFYQFSIVSLQDNKIIVKANEINGQPDLEKLTKKKKK